MSERKRIIKKDNTAEENDGKVKPVRRFRVVKEENENKKDNLTIKLGYFLKKILPSLKINKN